MFYHPNAYYVGASDVAAAWLLCIGVGVISVVSTMAIRKHDETARSEYQSAPSAAVDYIRLCAVPGLYVAE